MRVLLLLFVATPLLACEQLYEPTVTDLTLDPPATLGMRGGAVTWTLLQSDCPAAVQDLWRGEDRGYALVEPDHIELMFDTTPLVTGALVAGEADIRGTQTFMGDDGADVTCVVTGSAAIEGPGAAGEAIEGEMTEVLTSEGALNCASHARYRLVFD